MDAIFADLEDLGKNDSLLNEREIHVFSKHWKPGLHLAQHRVICEITENPQSTLTNFVYGGASLYVANGKPYVCRWLEDGEEKSHSVVAEYQSFSFSNPLLPAEQ